MPSCYDTDFDPKNAIYLMTPVNKLKGATHKKPSSLAIFTTVVISDHQVNLKSSDGSYQNSVVIVYGHPYIKWISFHSTSI